MKNLYLIPIALCIVPQLSAVWNGKTNTSQSSIYTQPRGTSYNWSGMSIPQQWGSNSDIYYRQAHPYANADIAYRLNRGDYNGNFNRWDNDDLGYNRGYQDYRYVPQYEKFSSANEYGLGADWAPDYNANRYENRTLNYGRAYNRNPYRTSRWL